MATYETILEATVKAGVEHFGGFPSGTMIAFAGKSVPDGWLLCNGALVSRTTYAKLFAAIGTAWGTGDGRTTFKLPDADGRVMQGVTDTSKVGQYLEAGLPNITGVAKGVVSDYVTIGSQGALSWLPGDRERAWSPGGGDNVKNLSLNAGLFNQIYSNSNTVQSPAIQTLIIIKV